MVISYRPRRPQDNPFLIRVSMQTMSKVIKKSTGRALTKTMILEQIDENQTTVVIESSKRPIGYYSYSILPSGQLYLSALILAPAVQNKGIGRRVAKRIEQEARAKDTHTIIGHIHYTNSKSLVFWLRNGYRILGPHMRGTLAVKKRLGRLKKRPHRS